MLKKRHRAEPAPHSMDRYKILFGTDFEPESLHLLKRVEQFATGRPAHILLLHAPPAWRAWVSSGLSEREAADRLRGWGEKLRAKGLDVDIEVQRGNAAERILDMAEAWNADLIAVGAGQGWKKNASVGTTAQAVVRHSDRDVWVGVPSAKEIGKLLCGFDGSERSHDALQRAMGLGQWLSAEIMVLAAIEGPDENLLGVPPDEEMKLLEAYKRERQDELERAAMAAVKEAPVEFLGVWGRGSEALRAKARDHAYDLIVLGRTGAGRVRRTLLGTTAERLLRDTPCSLYVVGPRGR